MNQDVIFADIQYWDSEQQKMIFPAQSQGMNISCCISLERLKQISEQDPITEAEIMAVFNDSRFDIEDIAEALIEAEAFDEQGLIQL
ncbi:DUF1488 domain-containing protein [Shewanella marina]|uniref:DUF1488 domain-containing protein n=1 Tax=Shewanella marina TaxID=487319 RepID=UPI0004714D1F|nr:DUF1488 domain-containing protein [Shewanella marina]